MTQHSITTLSNTAATRLTPNGIHSGMDITIQNIDGTAYVYIGGEGATSTNYGFRISPGAAFSIELSGKDSLYATTDTDGSQVSILKTNLEVGN